MGLRLAGRNLLFLHEHDSEVLILVVRSGSCGTLSHPLFRQNSEIGGMRRAIANACSIPTTKLEAAATIGRAFAQHEARIRMPRPRKHSRNQRIPCRR